MKFIPILFILFSGYIASAQQAKPYYNFPHESNGQPLTDTTKGFATAKWAMADIYDADAAALNMGVCFVVFDNGSYANLKSMFRDNPSLPRNAFFYKMAFFQYMDEHGFRLVSDSGDSQHYIFQREVR